MFGAELAEGKYYLFGHECKAAIFTWQGCTIEISFAVCCHRNRMDCRARHRNAVNRVCLRRDANVCIRECPSRPRKNARTRTKRASGLTSPPWSRRRSRSRAPAGSCPRTRKLWENIRMQNTHQLRRESWPRLDPDIREYQPKRGACLGAFIWSTFVRDK